MIMNLEAINNCKNEHLLPVLKKLKAYEKYCNLLSGDLGTYVKTHDYVGNMPSQLKEWLKLFDGGVLFTTSMFSTKAKEEGRFNRILTFAEINSPDFKRENGIPQDIVCFAMTNYGNYYCYVSSENSECLYEWDAEQNALTVKWNDFAEWLDEQIEFAESLINDDLLEPLEV